MALPSTLAFVSPGDRPWKLLGGPESRLWISSSYLVNRTPWPLGAGEGSVVLGNEAASLSDPCPHGQSALKSAVREQVLFGEGRWCGAMGRAPLGSGTSLNCDFGPPPPAPPGTPGCPPTE